MTALLIAITGTGTGVGKTHASEALVRALGLRGMRVFGHKPVESGVTGDEGEDQARLRRASTFHVKHPALTLREPVSPHLAARHQGTRLDVPAIACSVRSLASAPELEALLVELPGGLFTPLDPPHTNATLLRRLAPDLTFAVAPDRLGVLHDSIALHVAARAEGISIDAIALNAPETADASTGTNAEELASLVDIPVLATLPRAPADVLATHETIATLVALTMKRRARPPA